MSKKVRFPHADIHPSAYIGWGVHIGTDVVIGEGSSIYSGAYIGPRTIIGKNVTIAPNAVVGSLPFKFVTNGEHFFPTPAKGRVVIKDHVIVGSCTCIDRPIEEGAETVIGYSTHIDNLCQIGHDVKIGSDCLISAQTGIGGNAVIGNKCVLNGQTGIADFSVIPDGTIAVARAGLHGKTYKPHQVLAGSPAVPVSKFRRIVCSLPRLPEIISNIKSKTKKNWKIPFLP